MQDLEFYEKFGMCTHKTRFQRICDISNRMQNRHLTDNFNVKYHLHKLIDYLHKHILPVG